ncbi:YHS domain-containing protein [Pedobacter sp. ASV28]|uniref:YHS domain-containing protein n=1 Tax=Pedobacter sp. ASV28 TaxID=2795123 RepID=UPI0018EAAD78|nr:YHS domain-containing protein [Pedobacter sp. ASV28]
MKTTLIICIFVLGSWALYPGRAANLTYSKVTVLSDSIKLDPICKMKVQPSTVHKSTFNKQEYLFCSKGCKLKFDQNPEKYIKK